MKKIFYNPDFEIVSFYTTDIIQTSEVAPIELKMQIDGVAAQSYGEQDISIFN